MKTRKHLTLLAFALFVQGNLAWAADELSLNPSEWKFDSSENVSLQTSTKEKALALEIVSKGGSGSVYLTATKLVDWFAGTDSSLAIDLHAENSIELYFEVELTTNNGKSYRAFPSGEPTWPFNLEPASMKAELPLEAFVDADENVLPDDAAIVKLKLIFGPGAKALENAIYVEKVALEEAGGKTSSTERKTDGEFEFSSRQRQLKWIGQFDRWLEEDASDMPGEESMLLIGSSTIARWRTSKEDLSPVEIRNRGFGGSNLKQVLLMLDFFQRYPSDRVVLYQGDNDLLSGKLPLETFFEQVDEFIAGMRAVNPDVEICFVSIKPSPKRMKAIERYREANERLLELTKADPKLHYVDIFSEMLDSRGLPKKEIYADDLIHLNEKGYKILTAQLRQWLQLDQS